MGITHRSPESDEQTIAAIVSTLKSRPGGIESGELLSALSAQWGGADKLAKDIFGEFRSSPSGSLTRQRILQMLVSLVTTQTDKEYARPKSASDMTDQELQAYAEAHFKRLMQSQPKARDDAEATQVKQQEAGTEGRQERRPEPEDDSWLYEDSDPAVD